MIATRTEPATQEFYVIHPLFDEPEEKCDPTALGHMQMTKSVKTSLMLLRGYLIVMIAMLAYHLLDLAGGFGHHMAK